MRLAASLAAVAALTATAAHSAPIGPVSQVTVAIGPELREKADDYGARDIDHLARELQTSVERRLSGAGALNAAGGRLELVINDARPNRPTMRQLGDTPGLSPQSFGLGGAEIAGVYRAPDGSVTPVSYDWYEDDIRWSAVRPTWADARTAFTRFAGTLVR